MDSVAGSVVTVTGADPASSPAAPWRAITSQSLSGCISFHRTWRRDTAFSFEPPLDPIVGSQVRWENVTAFAKAGWPLGRESGVVSPWTRDFGGPWSVEWEESI